MKLIKLELKGFKSFGDKVTINFDEGVTGVVGPNGCGKSNIVDAMRWVLGEQKTTVLRSDKMENVIFNGTKNRKPLQLAEASLTFDNTKNILSTDYSQVTICRRYYRDGEGEYLLNGVQCRLKDITNLFLDTGIGPDSYSIIELKMVDDILKDKDNSRMQLFEEAAGVSKYKLRKKETFRKLETVDEDLKRVEDILFEIEKNLKAFEKQAKQVEKYNKLKSQLKEFNIEHTRILLREKSQQLNQLNSKLEKLNDEKTNFTIQVDEFESTIEKLKTELLIIEKNLNSIQKELNHHLTEIQQKENEKKIKHERLKYLHDREQSLNQLIQQDKNQLSGLKTRTDILSSDKIKEEAELHKISFKLQEVKNDYEKQNLQVTQLKEKINAKNIEFKEFQNSVFSHSKELEIKLSQIHSYEEELNKNEKETLEKNTELTQLHTAFSEISIKKTDKDKEREILSKKVEENENQISEIEKKIITTKDEINQITRQIDAKENEYELTKSMVDNLEGYPDSIKFLNKNSHWIKEVPLLSDVINCPDEYKIAIENFLEPYLNYFVVNDMEEARLAINLLSDAAKGKANFFILNQLNNYQPRIIYNYENTISALQIIETDSRYIKLAEYLLDNVYIVLKNQEEINTQIEATLLTVNGKFIKKNFSLSGGSVGLFEGKIIGRARNLDLLKKEIKSLNAKELKCKNKLSEDQHQLKLLKEKELTKELSNLNTELEKINQEYITLKTKTEQFESFLRNTNSRSTGAQSEIGKLKNELTDLNPKFEKEKEKLNSTEVSIIDLSEKLESENNLLNDKSNLFNSQNLIFHQQQNKIVTIDNEINFINKSIGESTGRIDVNIKELKQIQSETKEIIESGIIKDEDLVLLYQRKDEIEKNVEIAEKEFYSKRGEIEENEKKLRELQKQRENTNQIISQINDQINEIKLGLSSTKERLLIEYKIDIEEILQDNSEDKFEMGFLESEIKRINEGLERLGPVNPMATEAYNEAKIRFDFINNQKNDLINSKGSLLKTIEEIDVVAKESFIVAFHQIRENFIKVFRTLFSQEDYCDLILTDFNSPLDADIEIIAKPKGKKPQTISQLSGGEKALTAIAVLFAIYLLKPAPFCIFDEVDAPLDDYNIDKFNKIITEFSKDSQFIVVTHNKRTMQFADVIYGITMVEEGISRVVPVDLRSMVTNQN